MLPFLHYRNTWTRQSESDLSEDGVISRISTQEAVGVAARVGRSGGGAAAGAAGAAGQAGRVWGGS